MAEETYDITGSHAEPATGAATDVLLSAQTTGAEPLAEGDVNGPETSEPVPAFEWDNWSNTRRALGQDSQDDYEGSRTKLKEAAAMLAIEIANRPGYDWKMEAAELMLHVPERDHKFMAAAAAAPSALAAAVAAPARSRPKSPSSMARNCAAKKRDLENRCPPRLRR